MGTSELKGWQSSKLHLYIETGTRSCHLGHSTAYLWLNFYLPLDSWGTDSNKIINNKTLLAVLKYTVVAYFWKKYELKPGLEWKYE